MDMSSDVLCCPSTQVKKRCYHIGIGRLTVEEMYEVGLEDIRALSCYLGDNDFMCGTKPTAVSRQLVSGL